MVATDTPLSILELLGTPRPILTGAITPKVTLRDIEKVEAQLLQVEQKDCPVEERFNDGIYLRECTMPADTLVFGHAHKTAHYNIVMTGKAFVRVGDEVHEMKAGDIFLSGVGVRKLLWIVEEMKWITVHPNPTGERNQAKLREMFIAPSEAWELHQIENFQRQIKALL